MEREKMIEEIVSIMGEWAIENKMCWNSKHAESLVKYLMGKNVLKIPDNAVVLTKEELVKTMESGYVYDTTRGNKINLIEMAREIERKETAREIIKDLIGHRFAYYEIDEKYGTYRVLSDYVVYKKRREVFGR